MTFVHQGDTLFGPGLVQQVRRAFAGGAATHELDDVLEVGVAIDRPEEFAELTVSNAGGGLVKLGDVARVEPGPEDERSVVRYSRQPGVFVGVVRQSKANVVEVAEAALAELPAIQSALPAGVQLNMAYDGSMFVRRSIQEARETLLITAGIVIVIIFLFLRTFRATAIPALAIPVSIVATFAVLAALGFSVNSLTLLGLILAIGVVVDDAIIVMENAYRHQEEEKQDPETAAIHGTREITTAVIATTIALLAVFSPLLFLTGATGRLFNEFGVAVGGAVLVSGIVALTLTPMLSAKILRVTGRESRFQHAVGAVLDRINAWYERTLARAVRRPLLVIGGGVGLTAAAAALFVTLEREFVPPEEWPVVLEGFRRALRPGGWLYLTVELVPAAAIRAGHDAAVRRGLPLIDDGEAIWDEPDWYYHFYPAMDRVRAWVRDAAFEMFIQLVRDVEDREHQRHSRHEQDEEPQKLSCDVAVQRPHLCRPLSLPEPASTASPATTC